MILNIFKLSSRLKCGNKNTLSNSLSRLILFNSGSHDTAECFILFKIEGFPRYGKLSCTEKL